MADKRERDKKFIACNNLHSLQKNLFRLWWVREMWLTCTGFIHIHTFLRYVFITTNTYKFFRGSVVVISGAKKQHRSNKWLCLEVPP